MVSSDRLLICTSMASRGLSPDTVKHFGLGIAGRGSLKGRLAIPLRDHNAALVGYGGRLVDDSRISEENPRYRLPPKRERDGKLFEFRKTLFLYNGYRFTEPLDNLVVVEGFPSVWWLTQCRKPSVVATMGADCSERQAELIVSLVKPEGRVWFVPDRDDAGERFAKLTAEKGNYLVAAGATLPDLATNEKPLATCALRLARRVRFAL